MKKLKDIAIPILALLLLITSFYMDNGVMNLFTNARNSILDIPMRWITNFGSLFFVLILIPSLFSLRERKFNYIFYLWAAFFSSVIVSFILKFTAARPRPLSNISFSGIFGYSFPSMHALVAFAALPILDREFPKLRVFWILFAFFVAVSRLYFNLHYFSDVVAGALIGYTIGLLLTNLEQKYKIFGKVHKK